MLKVKRLHKERVEEDAAEKNVLMAGRGWLINFMKHFGLSLRRKTTTIQKAPEHLIDKIVSYLDQVWRVS